MWFAAIFKPADFNRSPVQQSRRAARIMGEAATFFMMAGFACFFALILLLSGSDIRAEAKTYQPKGDLIGSLSIHVTDGDKTLLDVAREHDLGVLEISATNQGLDHWVPGADKMVILPTSFLLPEVEHRGIVVNLAELRLYQFMPDGSVVTHAIGVGRDGFSTPLGKTVVTRKKAGPTWYPTAETRADMPELPPVVGPGPDNPLGDHAIYLGWPTYLIHGTNKPFGVGRRVSRGCIRMYPEAVAGLYARTNSDQSVMVINDPIKLGWSEGALWIEVHPDQDQLDELEVIYSFSEKPVPDVRQRIIDKAGRKSASIDWTAVNAALTERRGIPVRISEPVSMTDLHHTELLAASVFNLKKEFTGLY